jgi:hypothetical protein
MTIRERLKQFLLMEIESREGASEPDKELLKVLYEAVDGLDNLDPGKPMRFLRSPMFSPGVSFLRRRSFFRLAR